MDMVNELSCLESFHTDMGCMMENGYQPRTYGLTGCRAFLVPYREFGLVIMSTILLISGSCVIPRSFNRFARDMAVKFEPFGVPFRAAYNTHSSMHDP